MEDLGSIPGLGRSTGGRHGNPLQYSCLENPHGQRSLAGYSPSGCKELDMTEHSTQYCFCFMFFGFFGWKACGIFTPHLGIEPAPAAPPGKSLSISLNLVCISERILIIVYMTLASAPITSWQIEGEEVEAVTHTIFLGSKITAGGDCSHEIKRCLLLGRKDMTNLDSILKSRAITLPTKVHIVKHMVFPVVMYGCESWTIKKAEHQRTDAFELWC